MNYVFSLTYSYMDTVHYYHPFQDALNSHTYLPIPHPYKFLFHIYVFCTVLYDTEINQGHQNGHGCLNYPLDMGGLTSKHTTKENSVSFSLVEFITCLI